MKSPSIRVHLWFLAILIPLLLGSTLVAQVIPYKLPDAIPVSQVHSATIGGVGVPALKTSRGSVLSFGMAGPVDVAIKVVGSPKAVVVRPLSAGILARVEGDVVRFQLPRPMNLSVEMDGDLANPVFIFANPALTDIPDRNDPKVKFFEAGKIHEAGEILLRDGETLYLEGGAVVRAVVRSVGTSGVSVRGAGILDAGTRKQKINMLVLRECRDAVIENIILLDPLGWTMHLSASRNIRLRNTRVIGWRANSDGLDIEYSSDVQVDGCFWRTNDDCIAIKAIYPPGTKGVPLAEMIDPETLGGHEIPRVEGSVMENINISNCVLWNDAGGQGFEIGFELRIDTIRGVTFKDSDIIHVVKGGAFPIHNGDRARIENLLIENVRVENTDRVIDFHVGLSIYSRDCPVPYRRSNPQRRAVPKEHLPARANNPYQWFVPKMEDVANYEIGRGEVSNVVLRDVKVLGKPQSGSLLHGFSPNRAISGVTFENLVVDGRMISSPQEMDLFLEHTRDVRFTKP
ncbi:MAG: glycosyl hydrolase family 28 protein [Verrucomicrobiales bacterium]